MTTQIEANEIGAMLGDMVLGAVADAQENAPRTKQSTARILGMSEMAGCREYVRASIAGDVKGPTDSLKWAAFIGTAVGDAIENILQPMGFATQEDVQLTLPRTGITVTGHLDARTRKPINGVNAVIDLKTRNELAEVRRDGPPFKEKSQASGYLVAKVQSGEFDQNAIAVLVYLDRSGAEAKTYTWAVTYDQALLILDAVEDRLVEVAKALDTGYERGYLRDEPESYCYAISCPFYTACWDGYTPTGKITHPRELQAVQRLVEHRAGTKEQDALRRAARDELAGVEGIVDKGPLKGTIVRWTLSSTESGGVADRLDVRVPKS